MPVTAENLASAMSYHALDPQQQLAYSKIEAAATVFAAVILDVLPLCGDQQAALRHVFEAKATANRGVSIHGAV